MDSIIVFPESVSTSALPHVSCVDLLHRGLSELLFFPFICTVVGVWLGAFVIPLDWQRDWQVCFTSENVQWCCVIDFVEMANSNGARCCRRKCLWDIDWFGEIIGFQGGGCKERGLVRYHTR